MNRSKIMLQRVFILMRLILQPVSFFLKIANIDASCHLLSRSLSRSIFVSLSVVKVTSSRF